MNKKTYIHAFQRSEINELSRKNNIVQSEKATFLTVIKDLKRKIVTRDRTISHNLSE